MRDEDPRLLAYGVVGTVGYYGHFHRTGRMPIGQDELAAFVGRFVVCSLASNEKIARLALAAPAVPAWAWRSASRTRACTVGGSRRGENPAAGPASG